MSVNGILPGFKKKEVAIDSQLSVAQMFAGDSWQLAVSSILLLVTASKYIGMVY